MRMPGTCIAKNNSTPVKKRRVHMYSYYARTITSFVRVRAQEEPLEHQSRIWCVPPQIKNAVVHTPDKRKGTHVLTFINSYYSPSAYAFGHKRSYSYSRTRDGFRCAPPQMKKRCGGILFRSAFHNRHKDLSPGYHITYSTQDTSS